MEVAGVAATMIGEALPLGTITLLGIHDLHLPAAVITTLHLREGNTQGLFHLKRKDTVVRDHILLAVVREGHTHNPLQGSSLHHSMGHEAAVKVQSGSILHLIMVQGVAAGVQLGHVLRLEHVLQLGVTAGGGALVKAIVAGALMLFIIPGILIMMSPRDTEHSPLDDECCSLNNTM